MNIQPYISTRRAEKRKTGGMGGMKRHLRLDGQTMQGQLGLSGICPYSRLGEWLSWSGPALGPHRRLVSSLPSVTDGCSGGCL